LRISCREYDASAHGLGRLCLAALALLALLMWLITAGTAIAQGAPKQGPKKAKPSAVQQKAAPKPTLPDPYKLNLLIRSTILAVNQANQTGNYTVLRDLSSPDFQRANSAARLGAIFANLRGQGINLSPVILVPPALDESATITPGGMLKLVGHFPTKPLRINFQMLFQVVEGRWRLFGLAVNTVPAAAAAPKQTNPTAIKKKPKKLN
jgi:hypothetical protein